MCEMGIDNNNDNKRSDVSLPIPCIFGLHFPETIKH